jgi:hypothetical protein
VFGDPTQGLLKKRLKERVVFQHLDQADDRGRGHVVEELGARLGQSGAAEGYD